MPRILVAGVVAGIAFGGSPPAIMAGQSHLMDQAIARGVAFLAARQDGEGSFAVNRCDDATLTQCTKEVPVSGAILVLHALLPVPGPVAAQLRARTSAFLLQEQEGNGLWRYMPKSSALHQAYVPDIDDTAIAALALRRVGVALPAEHAAKLQQYRNAAGLFPTYMMGPENTASPAAQKRGLRDLQTVDCGVNANVLAYLAFTGEAAPEVCTALDRMAQETRAQSCSPYYPTLPALAHLIVRAYRAGAACLQGATRVMIDGLRAAQGPDGGWASDVDTALAVIALLDTGNQHGAVDRGIRALLVHQRADGSWPAGLYYTGLPLSFFYGSDEVTTAFALEALAKYQRMEMS